MVRHVDTVLLVTFLHDVHRGYENLSVHRAQSYFILFPFAHSRFECPRSLSGRSTLESALLSNYMLALSPLGSREASVRYAALQRLLPWTLSTHHRLPRDFRIAIFDFFCCLSVDRRGQLLPSEDVEGIVKCWSVVSVGE